MEVYILLKLISINEEIFYDVSKCLEVITKSYQYCKNNTRVIGITNDNQFIGIAIIEESENDSNCCDLHEFYVDKHYQNQGWGTKALKLIISQLQDEGKYHLMKVGIKKSNILALKVLCKIGFQNIGFNDTTDTINFIYYFRKNENNENYSDVLITNFLDSLFQEAFKKYFTELNVNLEDWDALFKEMNEEEGNMSVVRMNDNKEIIGFILFQPIKFSSWFFEETYGFIREFWVAEEYRNNKHGSELLKTAEKFLCNQGIYSFILTTDTSEQFYIKHGYEKVKGCIAKNYDDVYIKRINN